MAVHKSNGRNLNLTDITIDEGLQMRAAERNDDHIDDMAEAIIAGKQLGESRPVVFQDGMTLWLADGRHRYHAHEKAGKKKMECEVKQGSYHDALLYALGANQEHRGLRRSNLDKQKAVRTALSDEEIVKQSNRQIADMCGVSPGLVDKLRIETTAYDRQSAEAKTAYDRQSAEAKTGPITSQADSGIDPFAPEGKAVELAEIKRDYQTETLDEHEDDEGVIELWLWILEQMKQTPSLNLPRPEREEALRPPCPVCKSTGFFCGKSEAVVAANEEFDRESERFLYGSVRGDAWEPGAPAAVA